jgi:hypothetical protein
MPQKSWVQVIRPENLDPEPEADQKTIDVIIGFKINNGQPP